MTIHLPPVKVTREKITEILTAHPLLCANGTHAGHLWPTDDAAERAQRSYRESLEQVHVEWIQQLVTYLRTNYPAAQSITRDPNSSHLTRIAEAELGVPVSHGEIILAAMLAGYDWTYAGFGPSVCLNIDRQSYDAGRHRAEWVVP